MGLRRFFRAVAAGAVLMAGGEAQALQGPGGSHLQRIGFDDIQGWRQDNHAAAFRNFILTCRTIADATPAVRPGLEPGADLVSACRAALDLGTVDAEGARAFFEARFQPWRITVGGGEGFLTGYYEPEIQGARERSEAFPVPVLGRPPDLVAFRPGETPPELPRDLAGARRRADGGLEPYPDRAAIEDGALAGLGLERLYLPDRVELFFAQVQGSARVRLPDGEVVRLAYAGRNGRPYTSIGKVVVAEGHMPLETMTLAGLKGWLRAHPADARRIMRLNQSYVFFEPGPLGDPAEGPVGAASVPLTPLRSIAVDRTLWPYGLPFWIEADLPDPGGSPRRVARLFVAQDTGSAILGPARADIFFGSGPEAGDRAGLVRHHGRFTVLLPRPEPRP
jgi:membrane-bound lytic murein transglycosylase A